MKKVVFKFIPVPRCFVQISFGDMWNPYAFKSILGLERNHKLFQKMPKQGAARSKERESRSDKRRECHDIKLLSDLSVIPLFCFFKHMQMRVQLFLGRKRKPEH